MTDEKVVQVGTALVLSQISKIVVMQSTVSVVQRWVSRCAQAFSLDNRVGFVPAKVIPTFPNSSLFARVVGMIAKRPFGPIGPRTHYIVNKLANTCINMRAALSELTICGRVSLFGANSRSRCGIEAMHAVFLVVVTLIRQHVVGVGRFQRIGVI